MSGMPGYVCPEAFTLLAKWTALARAWTGSKQLREVDAYSASVSALIPWSGPNARELARSTARERSRHERWAQGSEWRQHRTGSTRLRKQGFCNAICSMLARELARELARSTSRDHATNVGQSVRDEFYFAFFASSSCGANPRASWAELSGNTPRWDWKKPTQLRCYT